MFSESNQSKTVGVFVTLIDGREMQGELSCGLTATIATALNSDGPFIELIDHSGHSVFIAKHQIASLELLKQGGKAAPSLQAAALDSVRWNEVLGVAPSAGADEVKQAYHTLAKQYHPDLYSDHLPSEMRAYAGDMLTRINKAYEAFQQVRVAA